MKSRKQIFAKCETVSSMVIWFSDKVKGIWRNYKKLQEIHRFPTLNALCSLCYNSSNSSKVIQHNSKRQTCLLDSRSQLEFTWSSYLIFILQNDWTSQRFSNKQSLETQIIKSYIVIVWIFYISFKSRKFCNNTTKLNIKQCINSFKPKRENFK